MVVCVKLNSVLCSVIFLAASSEGAWVLALAGACEVGACGEASFQGEASYLDGPEEYDDNMFKLSPVPTHGVGFITSSQFIELARKFHLCLQNKPISILVHNIRESVDSLCRDGADAQYMQYLSKSRITSPQTR